MIIKFWKGAATCFIWILFCSGHFSLTICLTVGEREKVGRPLSTSLCLKKGWSWSLQQNVVRYQLRCFFFPAFNFTFRNLIPFAICVLFSQFAMFSQLAIPCRFPCISFAFLLPQQTKAKRICLWQHCSRFKSYIAHWRTFIKFNFCLN